MQATRLIIADYDTTDEITETSVLVFDLDQAGDIFSDLERTVNAKSRVCKIKCSGCGVIYLDRVIFDIEP